jgi:signal peptidase II
VLDNGRVSTEHSSEPASSTAASPTDRTPPRRQVGLLVLAAAVVIGLDVATKVAAVARLEGRQPVPVAGGLVYLQLIRNPGAAFGIATAMTWVLALIAMGVAATIIWFAPRLRSAGWALGLGLVFGGAVGNLADRIFRTPGVLEGRVVDFISVFAPDGRVWPVFNVADSAICVGGALIVLMALLGRDYDGGVRAGAAGGRKADEDGA